MLRLALSFRLVVDDDMLRRRRLVAAEVGHGAELAAALRSGRPHRANGQLAHHVVEAMEAADRSAAEQRHVAITSSCERPAAVPVDLPADRFEG